jgi:RNA-directed DNA polymerase
MQAIKSLRDADNRAKFAELLGYSPKSFSYIVYKLSGEERYRSFEIPKKSGGGSPNQCTFGTFGKIAEKTS